MKVMAHGHQMPDASVWTRLGAAGLALMAYSASRSFGVSTSWSCLSRMWFR